MIDWRIGAGTVVNHWVRNPDWIAITTPAADEEKAVILKAVFNGSQEWTALSATDNYTVDWGDGNVESFASGVTAEHTYNYADADLHDSSTALGYKQAVITITPQVGQHLTSLNLHLRHSLAGSSIPESGFLDVRIAGSNLTSLLFGAQTTAATTQIIKHGIIERFELLNNSIADFGYLLNYCARLRSVPTLYTNSATTAAGLYYQCRAMTTYPQIETALCTSLAFLYFGNSAGIVFPFLNTSACLNMSNMHNGCVSAEYLPFYDMRLVTDLSSYATTCRKLKTVPFYNTASCLNFTSWLNSNLLIAELPLFDMSSATSANSSYSSLFNLEKIPAFNIANVTDLTAFVSGNYLIDSLPVFNTAKVITATSAFSTLPKLLELPEMDFSLCQTFTSMLLGNSSMRKTGIINAAAGTVFTTMYSGCGNLEYSILQGCRYTVSLANCKFSKVNLEAFIAALGIAATGTQTLTISGNPGTGTITSLSGTTTAGSKTVTFASTTGIVVGDRMTGTGSPLTTPIACTFTDSGDLVTVNNHGLSNGDLVSFVSIVTTTGIAVRTPYYVTNATTNTFTLAATAGGVTLPLTTNGSGTLIYDAVVESINPNVSITLSRPATSTSTSSKSFRALNTAPAVLRGWTISG